MQANQAYNTKVSPVWELQESFTGQMHLAEVSSGCESRESRPSKAPALKTSGHMQGVGERTFEKLLEVSPWHAPGMTTALYK